MKTTMRNLKINKVKLEFFEKIKVKEKIIGCDGGEDFGHPLVYLNLSKNGKQVCPYCSRLYILKK